jgi:hypothetical protein
MINVLLLAAWQAFPAIGLPEKCFKRFITPSFSNDLQLNKSNSLEMGSEIIF